MDKIDVAVIMGSQSDWQVMKHATDILQILQISHHAKIVSAHRTPSAWWNLQKLPMQMALR